MPGVRHDKFFIILSIGIPKNSQTDKNNKHLNHRNTSPVILVRDFQMEEIKNKKGKSLRGSRSPQIMFSWQSKISGKKVFFYNKTTTRFFFI